MSFRPESSSAGSPTDRTSPWMNDELRLFRSTLRKFLEREVVPQQARWRAQRRPDAEAWSRAGAMGMLLCDIPREYGGGGGTFAHEAVVREELAHAGVNFGSHIQAIVARYVLTYGSERQRSRWLPPLGRGELVAAIAMTEPAAGSDLQGIKTTARRDGDDYVLSGSKTFISNGWHAGLVCLAVKTDVHAAGPKGISLVVVETKGLAGYHVGNPLEKIGMHEQDTCELFFDDVRVPAANLLGPAEGKGLYQMMDQLPYERLATGVQAVAMAEEAVALTTRYVKERSAFGKQLIEFQNSRFKLAECWTAAHVGRVFVDDCIQQQIAGTFDAVTAAMAKYWLTDSLGRILDECVQLHGGNGYMAEYPIARMWADARAQRIYAGSNEIMKELISWSL